MQTAKVIAIKEPSDGGNEAIAHSEPFTVTVRIEGASDLLFHGWNAESVDEKARSAKNSKAKKTDNVESYVFRNQDGFLCIPGEYLHGSIINAAKFRQDPRSPRKSAMDLFKAGVVSLTPLATLGVKEWDYLDRRRVTIQRQGINRTRPAMRVGWKAEFQIMVLTPEYITRNDLREVVEMAGRLVGVGDFRPTFGRYGVIAYE